MANILSAFQVIKASLNVIDEGCELLLHVLGRHEGVL